MSPKALTILKSGVLAAVVAAGLASAVGAAARGPGGYGRDGLSEALGAVQLTDAQKQQIHAIRSAARTQDAPYMTQMRALQQQMVHTMLSSGTVTEAQLLPLVQQQESLRQQLDISRMQSAVAIRNLLTSDQLAQATVAQQQLAALHQQEHAITAPSNSQ